MTRITRTSLGNNGFKVWTDEEIRREFPKPIYVSLKQQFPELGTVQEFAEKICIFSHDRSVLHGVLSSRYQLIDHGQVVIDALNAIEQMSGERPSARLTALNMGGRARVEIELKNVAPVEPKVGDLVKLRLAIINSYDGLQQFSGTLDSLRLVCMNGAMVGKRFGGFSAKHFPGVSKKEGLLLERIQALVDRSADLGKLWGRWAQEQVEFEPAQQLLEKHFSKKYLTAALAPDSFPKTRWDLYNQLTYEATHNTRTEARRLEMDQVIANLFYTQEEVQKLAPAPK